MRYVGWVGTVIIWASVLAATTARAAEVTFTLTSIVINQNAGRFSLDVSVSPDDNAGLAGYDVEVLGIGSFEHVPPAGRIAGETPWTGMTIGGGNELTNGKFFAAQNSAQAGILAYGLAQASVDPIWPDVGIPLVLPEGWTGSLVTGTYSGPGLPSFGDEANATVFVLVDVVETIGSISLPPNPLPPADGDGDGDIDIDDFLTWQSAVDGGADYDSDGDTDGADYLVFQEMYPMPPGAYDGNGVDGPVIVHRVENLTYSADGDGDGDVDGDDFLLWQQSFGGQGFDADFDGDTDGDDFLIWQAQFGFGVDGGGGASQAVPEPAAWLLAWLVGTASAVCLGKWQ